MIPADKTSKKGPRKEPPFVRFWKHVQIGVGDCWLWIGAISTAGYPKFAVNTGSPTKFVDGHRYSYLIHNGSIQAGNVVMHLCNNKWCVRPSHLREGTSKENHAQARRDGLLDCPPIVPGGKRGGSKLTPAKVRKLRKLHSDGAGYRPLAKIFGISKTQAGRVVRRESWGHVS